MPEKKSVLLNATTNVPKDEAPAPAPDADADESTDVVAAEDDSPRGVIKDRLDKRAEKTERSLTKAEARAENVNKELRKGNIPGAANEVRKNVENRVDRLGKDIDNGVKKLRDAVSGGKKESSSESAGSDSTSGGSNAGNGGE